jgi:hypothetical protein
MKKKTVSDSQHLRNAKIKANWANQSFDYKLWLEEPKDKYFPTDEEKHQNRMWAIEQSLDVAIDLFHEHNLPIPTPFHALRLDLYEAIRDRRSIYFKSKSKSNHSMPLMSLKASSSAAVDLYLKAGSGNLEECSKLVQRNLKKYGLDIKKIIRQNSSHKAILEWRKSIKSRKPKTGADSMMKFIYDGNMRISKESDIKSEALITRANDLLSSAVRLFPDLLEKV